MNNMEDYVTYEQAIKLKEIGFDWRCQNHYIKQGCIPQKRHGTTALFYDYNKSEVTISAPTLTQAAKWLREVKGLFINVWLCASGFGWVIEKYGNPNYNGTFVTEHDGESGDDENSGLFTTYEKALSSGVDAALKLIK